MRGAILLSVTLLALGGVAGCSFPDVTYAPEDGSTQADVEPGPDGAAGDGRTGDAGADGSDASVDVVEDRVALDVVDDYVFEAAPDANPCDKDDDKHLDKSNPACGADADDCCDTDPRAHPGETSFWTTPDKCQSYDYNCDGTDEGEYNTNVACTSIAGIGCSGNGFIGNDPGCGYSGPFGSCMGGLASCNPSYVNNPPTQGCR